MLFQPQDRRITISWSSIFDFTNSIAFHLHVVIAQPARKTSSCCYSWHTRKAWIWRPTVPNKELDKSAFWLNMLWNVTAQLQLFRNSGKFVPLIFSSCRPTATCTIFTLSNYLTFAINSWVWHLCFIFSWWDEKINLSYLAGNIFKGYYYNTMRTEVPISLTEIPYCSNSDRKSRRCKRTHCHQQQIRTITPIHRLTEYVNEIRQSWCLVCAKSLIKLEPFVKNAWYN